MGHRLSYTAAATWTPAAAAYSAGDVVSVAQTLTWTDFNGLVFPGGELVITSVDLLIAHTAVISGETSYRLHLYSVTPPSAHADNDAWDLPSGDRTAYRGYIDLGSPTDVGSTLFVQTDGVNKQISNTATGRLFGELVTNGGFTATAVARTVTLHAALV